MTASFEGRALLEKPLINKTAPVFPSVAFYRHHFLFDLINLLLRA